MGRGASKVRVRTSSRSPGWAGILFSAATLLPFRLQGAQMRFESIEALFPEATVLVKPVVGVFQGGGLQLAGAPLRLAAPRDQPGALQHLQVLGNRRQAH